MKDYTVRFERIWFKNLIAMEDLRTSKYADNKHRITLRYYGTTTAGSLEIEFSVYADDKLRCEFVKDIVGLITY